jgi:hypothetical protein
MRPIRRIEDDRAGFVKDISEIIALEAWKNPSLIPDLSRDQTLFVFSDYSQSKGRYRTYSFYVFGRSGADYFNAARKHLRKDFHLGRRRMSFKQLNDKVKLRALSAFLDIAGAIDGVMLTFAVDARVQFMFAEQCLEVDPVFFGSVKKRVLEDMLRIVHFGAQAVMTVFNSGQNVVWFTDSDPIVANEGCEQLFGKLAECTIRNQFLKNESVGRIGFGITSIDDGSLELEDFASVPDLVAGALCETLTELAEDGLRVASKLALGRPEVSEKTNLICQWIAKSQCPLKKFGVVIDRTGSGVAEWRPTFFSIGSSTPNRAEICCGGQRAATFESDPVRFDVC